MAKRITIFSFIFLGLLARVPYSPAQGIGVNEQGANMESSLPIAEEGQPADNFEIASAAKTPVEFTGRDPFWPVGYVPQPKGRAARKAGAAEGAQTQAESDQSALDLAGLSAEEQQVIRERMRLGGVIQQAGEIWAILNNQLVMKGEVVTLDTGRKTYLFLVKQLTPDRIVLESKQDP